MAKAVTLRQFSEENVDYDVEFFASKLPPKYPGYIIVCVFVDRTRWTVELNRTGYPESPIRITQIRTTDNRGPDTPTEMNPASSSLSSKWIHSGTP